ncbi:Gfo/Idh/MocA family protein [Entomobacter blattae]|uniref:Inositol 2-dehydrogenase/D-chiro-inositol 3-dehydrogenase n=1 Tax=Entomobacter blattae TaxID=2762277 RepID=A0A7H1NRR6_9PROT|nr:Gfo/Idh/MocA family oxidoreductase [Entomobacter blattae]QNT78476.1 Inositol 2-dehydrogenase/D-chiro-inositol 3-dehydrogenase [Entomobacter blattae]
MKKITLGVGVIGSGFMGKIHAWAFGSVGRIFALQQKPVLSMMADISAAAAARAANQLSFERSTGDWRELVHSPDVDIVSIATPNIYHAPMALEAIKAGKYVYCEKPMATTLRDALEMTRLAEEEGVITIVGFNYLRNPMIRLARDIIESGEIGEPTGYRGVHSEGFMADKNQPYTWRCEKKNAGGATSEIGSHVLATARYLLGDIDEVCGQMDTIYHTRPAADGSQREVNIDDQMNCLVKFKKYGFTGTLTASWLATGRAMHHGFELSGSKGSMVFDQSRFNELQLYKADQRGGRKGFTRIELGPEHGDYGAFCLASGHQLGFNDLKILEVKKLLDCIATGRQTDLSFRDALQVTRVSEAIARSSEEGCWVEMTEIEDLPSLQRRKPKISSGNIKAVLEKPV